MRKAKKVEKVRHKRSALLVTSLIWSLTPKSTSGLASVSARLRHGEYREVWKHLPKSLAQVLSASLARLQELRKTIMSLKVLLKVVKKEARVKVALQIRKQKELVLISLPTGSQTVSSRSGPNSQISPLLILRLLVKLRSYSQVISKDQSLLTHSSSVERSTIWELRLLVLFTLPPWYLKDSTK